ncbi:unnamed protein product, partial [Mesorhabditis spiculigera]
MKHLLLSAILLAVATWAVDPEPFCKTDADCVKGTQCDQKKVFCKCRTTWSYQYRPCNISNGEDNNPDCPQYESCMPNNGETSHSCVRVMDKGVDWIVKYTTPKLSWTSAQTCDITKGVKNNTACKPEETCELTAEKIYKCHGRNN